MRERYTSCIITRYETNNKSHDLSHDRSSDYTYLLQTQTRRDFELLLFYYHQLMQYKIQ